MLWEHTSDMTTSVSALATQPSAELTATEASPHHIADLVMGLLAGLSEFERERFLQILTERVQAIATPRAGKTLGAVVDHFKQERDRPEPLTIEDIRAAISKRGVQATPKEVYNALGYLTRKRHIRRVGHGQYVIGHDQEGSG
jgi:hypothetical protein